MHPDVLFGVTARSAASASWVMSTAVKGCGPSRECQMPHDVESTGARHTPSLASARRRVRSSRALTATASAASRHIHTVVVLSNAGSSVMVWWSFAGG